MSGSTVSGAQRHGWRQRWPECSWNNQREGGSAWSHWSHLVVPVDCSLEMAVPAPYLLSFLLAGGPSSSSGEAADTDLPMQGQPPPPVTGAVGWAVEKAAPCTLSRPWDPALQGWCWRPSGPGWRRLGPVFCLLNQRGHVLLIELWKVLESEVTLYPCKSLTLPRRPELSRPLSGAQRQPSGVFTLHAWVRVSAGYRALL